MGHTGRTYTIDGKKANRETETRGIIISDGIKRVKK
jgi:hypothetical protein